MAYPDDLPTFTNPLASDPRVGHATLHGAVNDALEEVAAYVAAGMRRATVTLSSADILDLHNTPVQIVAAPGAGKWLNAHRVSAYHDFGTVAYTTNDQNGVAIGIPAVSAYTRVGNVTTTQDFLDAKAVPLDGNAADVVNAAVSAFGDGTTFTDGDGTLIITVWYSIEDVP